MIEILPQSTKKTIGFKISVKVTAEEDDILLTRLDEAINTHGKINLLARMSDCSVGMN